MSRILVVVAHPDDEVLGCGGTVANFIKAGYEAYTLILGEGLTSRDHNRNSEKRKKEREIQALKDDIYKANKIIGIKDVFLYDLPDNRFDTIALLDIIKIIESLKTQLKPEIIFTHHNGDLNIDHRITYEAVITAARPLPAERIKKIYSFAILSSTEWNYPTSFSPNLFCNIEDTLKVKLKAMKAYKSEIRNFPHPRSLEGISLNAQWWGMKAGLRYAEAFMVIREIQ